MDPDLLKNGERYKASALTLTVSLNERALLTSHLFFWWQKHKQLRLKKNLFCLKVAFVAELLTINFMLSFRTALFLLAFMLVPSFYSVYDGIFSGHCSATDFTELLYPSTENVCVRRAIRKEKVQK